MNIIKRIFHGRLLPRELVAVRKMVAIITLPVMVFYMTSLNFLVAGLMEAKAQEATVENVVTSQEEVSVVEKKTEVAPEIEEPVAPVTPVEEVTPINAEPAVVNAEVKTDPPKVEVAPAFSAPAEVFPPVEEAPVPDSFNITTDALPTTPTVEAMGPASAEKLVPAWNTDSKKATTSEAVQLNKTYVAPQNDQVTVTFTKLPANPGKLSIEEITLSDEQVASLHALSNKAYDITSDMTDGTFEYSLTLPKPKNQENVQVKFAEDVAGLANAETVASGDVKTETNSISAELDHFTIFVVVNPNPAGNGNESNDVCLTATGGGAVTCYDTIQAAVTAAASGDTINLNSDIVLASALNIDKSVTIDGAGFTLTRNAVNVTDIESYAIMVSAGTLTASNLKIVSKTTGTHIETGSSAVGITVQTGANLILSGSTITAEAVYGLVYGVYAQGANNVTLSSNTFTFSGTDTTTNAHRIMLGVEGIASTLSLSTNTINSTLHSTQETIRLMVHAEGSTLAAIKTYAASYVATGEKLRATASDAVRKIYTRTASGWTVPVTETVVAGVTPPVTGATPVTTITAGTQYTGAVTWSPTDVTFGPSRTYTATITLSATSGYSLVGVTANQFTVAGSTSATNSADSGIITAIFPATDAKQLTITDPSLTLSKAYDGDTGAGTVTAGSLSGVFSPDDVTVSAVANYDNKNVGTGKTITVVYTLGGADAAKYIKPVNYEVATGIITARPITVTSAANTKIYDGLLTAAGVPTITTGTLATGDVSTFSETYDNKNVGTTHVLTPAGTIADGSAVNMTANYDITFTTIATGIITQATSTTEVTCPTDSQTYTGSAITPCTVSVTGVGGLSLTPDPTYADNVNVGIATASYTYTGDTNHTGSSDSTTFSIGQTEPDEDGNVILDNGNPQAVLTDGEQAVTIEVETGTENPTIDVSALLTGGTATLPEITIYTEVAEVFIPAGTAVTGPAGWDGVINAPTAGTPSGGNAPAGFAVGETVITLGSASGMLLFNPAVVITLPGVTGVVGYRPAGSNQWIEITNVCTGTYADPTGAPAGGECAINDETDTKILTYHFTSFGDLLDTRAPETVDNFKGVYRPITGDVKLTWDVNDGDISEVSIYRGTTQHYTLNSHSRLNTQDRRDEDYTDTEIALGKTYYYKIVTKDEAGNKSDVKVIKITIPTAGETAFSEAQPTEPAPMETATQGEAVTGGETGTSITGEAGGNDQGSSTKGSVLGETTDQGSGNQQSGFWASNWKWFLVLIFAGGAIFFWRRRRQGSGNVVG